jgi:hypothetical protein
MIDDGAGIHVPFPRHEPGVALRQLFCHARPLTELEGLRFAGCGRMHLCHMRVEFATGTRHKTAGWTDQFFATTDAAAFGRRGVLRTEGEKLSHIQAYAGHPDAGNEGNYSVLNGFARGTTEPRASLVAAKPPLTILCQWPTK